jgi:hypothetical protein
MKTPFTVEQFLEVFRNYNTTVWPMQVLFYLLGCTAILLIFVRVKNSDKGISLVLSLFWIWIGVVYQLLFFAAINKAAYAFGVLFILQGILFLLFGIIKPGLTYRPGIDFYRFTGALFLFYALLAYPVLGYFSGHPYPYSPTFGLPCPTVIFTFGMLMFTDKKVPAGLLVIPFIGSIIGFSASVSFGILEDIGLLIAGISGTVLIIVRNLNDSKIPRAME